ATAAGQISFAMVRWHFGSLGYLSALLSGIAAWWIPLRASCFDSLPPARPREDSPRIPRARWVVDSFGLVLLGVTTFARTLVETYSGCSSDCRNLEAATGQRRRALPLTLEYCAALAKLVCPSRAWHSEESAVFLLRVIKYRIAPWTLELSVISGTSVPAQHSELALGRRIWLLRSVLRNLRMAGALFESSAN